MGIPSFILLLVMTELFKALITSSSKNFLPCRMVQHQALSKERIQAVATRLPRWDVAETSTYKVRRRSGSLLGIYHICLASTNVGMHGERDQELENI